MGAAPSIITIPSTSIAKDVECIKSLTGGRFRLEKSSFSNTSSCADELILDDSKNATTAVLIDKTAQGEQPPLTLLFVAIPVAAASRIATNRTTFVLSSDAELKNYMTRCEPMRLLTKVHYSSMSSSKKDDNALLNFGGDINSNNSTNTPLIAELNLPGGAGFALVSPAAVATSAARLELGQKMAETMIKSLPKGVSRVNSFSTRGPTGTTPVRSNSSAGSNKNRSSTPRAAITRSSSSSFKNASTKPERRQSFGSRAGMSPRNNNNGRESPTISKHSPLKLHSPMKFKNVQSKVALMIGSSNLTANKDNNNTTSTSNNSNANSNQQVDPTMPDGSLPLFPTLKFNSLHLNGKYRHDFTPNARAPIPIETEFFVGHMVFLLRPNSTSSTADTPAPAEDPYWNDRVFDQTNRRLVLQLQGKFKHEPKGPVYAGIEASKALKFGRLSKGLAGLFLKWAKEKNQQLFYTFGNDKEKARVVVPAHTFFDKIVVTPAGKTPPSILEPFLKERQESIDNRKKLKQHVLTEEERYDPFMIQVLQRQNEKWLWNISDTYTMSFCTSNLDLPTWSLLDVPQLNTDLGLRSLLGSALLRFVMYESFTPEDKGGNSIHLHQYMRYAYVVQVRLLGFISSWLAFFYCGREIHECLAHFSRNSCSVNIYQRKMISAL